MGIATFESELKFEYYDEWLNDLEEEPIENDADYDLWCEEQIRLANAIDEIANAKPCIMWLDEIEPILKEEAKEQERERTACERIIEGYKDLTRHECDVIFDTMCEAKRESGNWSSK